MRLSKLLLGITLSTATLGAAVGGAFALNNSGSNETTNVAEAAGTEKIYRFTNTSSWSNVYVHAWNGQGDLDSWPGTDITSSYSFNSSNQAVHLYKTTESPTYLIFHNNAGTQTGNIPIGSDTAWYWTDSGDTKVEAWTVGTNKYYFYDYHNQFKTTGVCLYAYGSNHGDNNASWPGVAMTAVANSSGNIYECSIDPMFDRVIFNNNNNGAQTKVDSDWANQKVNQCMDCYTTVGGDTISASWNSNMNDIYANDWVFQFMHFREIPTSNKSATGACLGNNGYYKKAVDAYQSYDDGIKTKISEYTEWGDAQARLIAWAKANGKTASFSGTTLTVSSNAMTPVLSKNTEQLIIVILVAISLACITAIGGYFYFKKRKTSE